MLEKEQKKWIEDNYDLVRMAVQTYATNENEQDTIESYASLILCECLNEQIQSSDSLRDLIWKILKIAIPLVLEAEYSKWDMEIPLPNCVLDDIGKYYLWGKSRWIDEWGDDIADEE